MKKFIALTVLAVLALSTSAMAAEKRFISVAGSGVLKVEPNIAYINVGVRTSNKEAEAASKENSAKTLAVIEKLTEAGILKKDIRTQNYNIYPMYDGGDVRGEMRVTSYEVSNSLTVTVRNIENVGKIIDAAIEGGSNMMNGLSYSVEDTSVYYGQLYEKALTDANNKANAIAKAMGVTISKPSAITESGYAGATAVYKSLEMGAGSMAASNMAGGTYTTPGEIELTAALSVSYEY